MDPGTRAADQGCAVPHHTSGASLPREAGWVVGNRVDGLPGGISRNGPRQRHQVIAARAATDRGDVRRGRFLLRRLTRLLPPASGRPAGSAASRRTRGGCCGVGSGSADPGRPERDPTRRMPPGGWIQGYNTQLAVSEDQIVLGVKVTNATVDVEQFEPMLAAAARGAEA